MVWWILAALLVVLALIAHVNREQPYLDADNPYLHPECAADVLPEDMAAHCPLPVGAQPQLKGGYIICKRLMDLIFSFLLLILLSPLYLVIAAAVAIDDPGPVLFCQLRVGRDKHYFKLHKFRTMKQNAPHDVPTHLLADPDQYLTRVGRILRNSSLDELPQLWDIFRGRMSLIGPRPALWNQADLIAEREKEGVNRLVPGLTGWAQINGRDELTIPEKAALDAEYLRKFGFALDLKCFFGTILAVLKREGVAGAK